MLPLSIWRLTPLDFASPLWKFSTFRGAVLVRACNEKEARQLAGERFGTGPIDESGTVEIGDAWASPFAVSCVSETNNEWPTEGDVKILWFGANVL